MGLHAASTGLKHVHFSQSAVYTNVTIPQSLFLCFKTMFFCFTIVTTVIRYMALNAAKKQLRFILYLHASCADTNAEASAALLAMRLLYVAYVDIV